MHRFGHRVGLALGLFLFAVFAAWTCSVANAQQKPSPFASPQQSQSHQSQSQHATPPATLEPPGMTTRAWMWLLTQQSRMNRDMTAAVKGLKSGDPMRSAGLLILIAFLYGVLHAAGPGHGKAVISSYVLTNEETVRRGIALSFLSALFQAISAIVFVGIFAMLLNHTSIQMRASEAWLESASWGLVAAIGAYMLLRQMREVFTRKTTAAAEIGRASCRERV